MFATDVVVLTGQERVLLLVVGVIVGGYILLQRLGRFSWPLYGLVSGVAVVFGLNILGTDIVGQLISSPAFSLLAIGALFIAYQGIQAYRAGKSTTLQLVTDRVRRR